jgi:cellulose synthase/poly-beta-1,6-N-acetylglucosamine synthase-like glycosyltransferase
MQSTTISVGICAYNEEANIGNLLKDIIEQHLPPELKLNEIIVVSSGSTDRTDDIVRKMAETDTRIKLIIEKTRKGKAEALNKILAKAKGDILVVISADTRLPPKSLVKIVKSIEKPGVGGACAATIPICNKNSATELFYSFLWRTHKRLLYEEEKTKGTLSQLGGDMWAIRRGIITHIPSNIINDDIYLGIKLREKGWRITFNPQSKVFIKSPTTPIEYIQQRERIIIGHKQIKEITCIEPVTISKLTLKKPSHALKILLNEIKMYNLNERLKIIGGFFLEFIAQILAQIKMKEKHKYVKWKRIPGTKHYSKISNMQLKASKV